ncbi:MAG: pyroglutamyl-peptidase I, partial [Zhenhengia sp.]
PVDTSVFADGENAYFTNLPVKAMVAEMVKAGLPASLSNTAGTFVCNHVMYGVLYMINKKYPHMRGGFIHVPYITQQVATKANTPSMSIEDITRGLEICIKVISETKDDIKVAAGTIC